MRKVETIKFNDFMNSDVECSGDIKIKIVGKVIIVTCLTTTFIAISDTAFAADAIDRGARTIYDKLLSIGKWIIIVKGGIDTINSTVQGDLNGAKKSFISYLVIYLVLMGLPWSMDQVDQVFSEM